MTMSIKLENNQVTSQQFPLLAPTYCEWKKGQTKLSFLFRLILMPKDLGTH